MSAAAIRPTLDLMRASWLQLRPWEGQEWLVFSALTTFRCGMDAIYFGINGAPATHAIPLEPCYPGTAVPYAQLDLEGFPPYQIFSTDKVQSVTIRLVLDDGSEMLQTTLRPQMVMPNL